MTVQQWFGTRQPAQPPALAQRIAELAGAASEEGDVPGQLLSAAEQALRTILTTGNASRDSALDVLAIDALVTYAFEAAAAEPERIPELAARAMSRLSHAARA